MKHLSYIIVTVVFICSFITAAGQQFVSNTVINIKHSMGDELSLFEVKTVSEFIERFNDVNSYLRRKYRQVHGRDLPYSHEGMIYSLFDIHNKKNERTIIDFIKNCTGSKRSYISISDTNLYSSGTACFSGKNGTQLFVPLIFRMASYRNGGSYWIIAGMGDDNINCTDDSASFNKISAFDSTMLLPPNAHNANFVMLNDKFVPGMQPEYYFSKSVINTHKCKCLIKSIQNGEMKLEYIKDVQFHFFQLKGWMFSLKYFDREDVNNGWLINHLQRIADTDRQNATDFLLRHKFQNHHQSKDSIGSYDTAVINRKALQAITDFNDLINLVAETHLKYNAIVPLIKPLCLPGRQKELFPINYSKDSSSDKPYTSAATYLARLSDDYTQAHKGSVVFNKMVISPVSFDDSGLCIKVVYTEDFDGQCRQRSEDLFMRHYTRTAWLQIRKEKLQWKAYIQRVSIYGDIVN